MIDDPDSDVLSELESDEDSIPIRYRLPKLAADLYSKLRSQSSHIICNYGGQQLPGLVTKKCHKQLQNIQVKFMSKCNSSCNTLWKWAQEPKVAIINISNIVALIPPPQLTTNRAISYKIPRMARSYKTVYNANKVLIHTLYHCK